LPFQALPGKNGERMMEKEQSVSAKPDVERLELVRRLPKKVMETLTKEEVKALLHDDEWPNSLKEKLRGFLEDTESTS
jgi:hypothetical protein